VWQHQAEVLREVRLRRSTLDRVRRALCAVVNREGTAGRARLEGFEVCGKTGTAQVRGRETAGPAPKEHAWFAGYAPDWSPRFAVAVLVEHGGHGGETAAPVARALLEAALQGDGMLPRVAEPGSVVTTTASLTAVGENP
jgi:penicillin-binding protein 2